jgi:hypothetical protein
LEVKLFFMVWLVTFFLTSTEDRNVVMSSNHNIISCMLCLYISPVPIMRFGLHIGEVYRRIASTSFLSFWKFPEWLKWDVLNKPKFWSPLVGQTSTDPECTWDRIN